VTFVPHDGARCVVTARMLAHDSVTSHPSVNAQMRQMLHRLSRQTFVDGKRVPIEKLPRLPKRAAPFGATALSNAFNRRVDRQVTCNIQSFQPLS
jgi:hypothetical protein